jgi:hypothetical protein
MIVLALAFQLSASWAIAQDRAGPIERGRRLFTATLGGRRGR